MSAREDTPCAVEGCAIVGATMLLPVHLCRRDASRLVSGTWRLKVTLELLPARFAPLTNEQQAMVPPPVGDENDAP